MSSNERMLTATFGCLKVKRFFDILFSCLFAGSLTTFSNINVIANPSYEGPSALAGSRSQASPIDDMRGHLV